MDNQLYDCYTIQQCKTVAHCTIEREYGPTFGVSFVKPLRVCFKRKGVKPDENSYLTYIGELPMEELVDEILLYFEEGEAYKSKAIERGYFIEQSNQLEIGILIQIQPMINFDDLKI